MIERYWLSGGTIPGKPTASGGNVSSSVSCPKEPWCPSGCTAHLVQALTVTPRRACSFFYNSHSSYAEFEAARRAVARTARVAPDRASDVMPSLPGFGVGVRVHYVTILREPVARVLSEYKHITFR